MFQTVWSLTDLTDRTRIRTPTTSDVVEVGACDDSHLYHAPPGTAKAICGQLALQTVPLLELGQHRQSGICSVCYPSEELAQTFFTFRSHAFWESASERAPKIRPGRGSADMFRAMWDKAASSQKAPASTLWWKAVSEPEEPELLERLARDVVAHHPVLDPAPTSQGTSTLVAFEAQLLDLLYADMPPVLAAMAALGTNTYIQGVALEGSPKNVRVITALDGHYEQQGPPATTTWGPFVAMPHPPQIPTFDLADILFALLGTQSCDQETLADALHVAALLPTVRPAPGAVPNV